MQGLTPTHCLASVVSLDHRRGLYSPFIHAAFRTRTPEPCDGTAMCGCQPRITFIEAFLCCWFLGAENSLGLFFAQVGKVLCMTLPEGTLPIIPLQIMPCLDPLISFSTNLGHVFLFSLQTTHFVFFFCPTRTNVITNNHAPESILGSHLISHSK